MGACARGAADGRGRRAGRAGWALTLALLLSACSTGALAAGNSADGGADRARSDRSTSAPSPVPAPSPSPSPIGEPGSTSGGTSDPPAGADPAASPSSTAGDGPAPAAEVRVQPLPDGLAQEASGITRATSDPAVFFVVDDGNGDAALDAIRITADGARRAGHWLVDQVTVGNPEALASGTCGPRGPADATCLYLGDIGEADRRNISVLRLVEPVLAADPAASAGTPDDPVSIVAQELLRYTYPGDAPDAEAMAIDTDGSVLILSKPAKPDRGEPGDPVRLYRGSPDGGELTLLTEFRLPAPQRPVQSRLVGVRPTDMAVDGDRVLVLTYDQVLEYRRPDPAALTADFPTWPVRELPAPNLPQAEGITGLGDGCGFAVASEAGPGGTTGSLATVSC